MPGQNVLTGGRARLFIDSQPMGWALGVDITEDIQQEPVNVLDQLTPAEYEIVGYTVQMSARIYRVPAGDLVARGIWPQGARTAEEMKQILLDMPEMSAEVWDTYADVPVGKIYRVKPRSRQVSIQARGLVAQNVAFTAIFFSDEGTSDI